jgi:uncharacterized protein YejL (UPF0352 family)
MLGRVASHTLRKRLEDTEQGSGDRANKLTKRVVERLQEPLNLTDSTNTDPTLRKRTSQGTSGVPSDSQKSSRRLAERLTKSLTQRVGSEEDIDPRNKTTVSPYRSSGTVGNHHSTTKKSAARSRNEETLKPILETKENNETSIVEATAEPLQPEVRVRDHKHDKRVAERLSTRVDESPMKADLVNDTISTNITTAQRKKLADFDQGSGSLAFKSTKREAERLQEPANSTEEISEVVDLRNKTLVGPYLSSSTTGNHHSTTKKSAARASTNEETLKPILRTKEDNETSIVEATAEPLQPEVRVRDHKHDKRVAERLSTRVDESPMKADLVNDTISTNITTAQRKKLADFDQGSGSLAFKSTKREAERLQEPANSTEEISEVVDLRNKTLVGPYLSSSTTGNHHSTTKKSAARASTNEETLKPILRTKEDNETSIVEATAEPLQTEVRVRDHKHDKRVAERLSARVDEDLMRVVPANDSIGTNITTAQRKKLADFDQGSGSLAFKSTKREAERLQESLNVTEKIKEEAIDFRNKTTVSPYRSSGTVGNHHSTTKKSAARSRNEEDSATVISHEPGLLSNGSNETSSDEAAYEPLQVEVRVKDHKHDKRLAERLDESLGKDEAALGNDSISTSNITQAQRKKLAQFDQGSGSKAFTSTKREAERLQETGNVTKETNEEAIDPRNMTSVSPYRSSGTVGNHHSSTKKSAARASSSMGSANELNMKALSGIKPRKYSELSSVTPPRGGNGTATDRRVSTRLHFDEPVEFSGPYGEQCDTSTVGDGYCDPHNFSEECWWDLGDCRFYRFTGCPCAESLLADGVCNSKCDLAICNYDGGDCSHSSLGALVGLSN